MQIGGLGGSHSTRDHHVTNCIHDHHDVQKETGAMAMKSSAAMEVQAAKGELQQEGLFSLASWLRNTLGSGRGLLLNFWGDGQTSGGSMEGSKAIVGSTENGQTVSQVVAHTGDADIAAMSAQITMQTPTNNTGYFSAARDRRNRKQTLWQKIRARFQNESEQLNGRRRKKFYGLQTKSSSQAKREQPEEDLRKSSRYRRDTVEINVARTEDDYLMDSYDSRGEYSRLTTKK